MLIYKNYIIKSILPSLIVITIVITSVVWVTQVLKLLYLIDKGINITSFFNVIVLVLPYLLFTLLPFITTIATIYTYNYLSDRRQLLIFQASGLSNLQLAAPALLLAFIITLFAYYLSLISLPLSYTRLKTNLEQIKNNYASSMINEKTFSQVSKNLTIYVNKKLPDATLHGLILFDNRNPNNQAILFAKSGSFRVYDNNPVFQLNHGIRQMYDSNGNLTRLSFVSLVVELSNETLRQANNAKDDRSINEQYVHELLYPNDKLPKHRRIKLIADGHQRLIWPLYNFVLTSIALSIFLKHPYNKKAHLRPIIFSTLLVVIFTYLHFTLQNMATRDLNFTGACYLNVIISLLLSFYLFKQNEFSRFTWVLKIFKTK